MRAHIEPDRMVRINRNITFEPIQSTNKLIIEI